MPSAMLKFQPAMLLQKDERIAPNASQRMVFSLQVDRQARTPMRGSAHSRSIRSSFLQHIAGWNFSHAERSSQGQNVIVIIRKSFIR